MGNTFSERELPVKVTIKGQVTIPRDVRERLGIRPAESEVEFLFDDEGRCYIRKRGARLKGKSRFHEAHKIVRATMSTEELMALTRGEWGE